MEIELDEIELNDSLSQSVRNIDTPTIGINIENNWPFAYFISSFFTVPLRIWVMENPGSHNSEYLASCGSTIVRNTKEQLLGIGPDETTTNITEDNTLATPKQVLCDYDAIFCSFVFDDIEEEKVCAFLQSIPSYTYMCIETTLVMSRINTLLESADYTIMETQTQATNTWVIAIKNRPYEP